jgi:hypothetical protein
MSVIKSNHACGSAHFKLRKNLSGLTGDGDALFLQHQFYHILRA